MTKNKSRLLYTLLILLVIVLFGLGLFLGYLSESYFLDSFDKRFKKESKLVTTYVEDLGGIQTVNHERMRKISNQLNARITLINRDGTILYDSGKISEMGKKEYQQIIQKKIDNKPRHKQKLKNDYSHNIFYYWEPIIINGSKDGFLLLSTDLTEQKQDYTHIWWVFSISFSLAIIVILIIGRNIMNRYTKPIERATNVAFELAKGNYHARTYEDQIGEIGMLHSSLNILARNLQDMMKSHEMQKDRLSTLIENMGSGLILIDSRGYINLINRTYKEIFDVDATDYLYKLYYEVIQFEDINKIIENIFITEQKVKKQIVIPLKIERRHFEVYGVPIIGTNDVWKGVLLVFHDITEIKKLEQIRKDFVANVSHELKTPVTSILGFSETLLDGAMEDKQTLEAFLTIILKESARLQSLINDLLELSKIENQGFSLSIQPLNLITVLEETVKIIDGKADKKNITIIFKEHPSEIFLEGDIYRLKQIFLNIVTNALLYTPNGGKVIIEVKDSSNSAIVHITDTGLGIDKEEIPRIFERFYRVNKSRDRNSGGTGLGLAIVKHILEAHRGKVTVESEPGKGTTFSIVLRKKFYD